VIVDIALVLGGLALLVLGGDLLVKGAVNLALRLGITPLVVGLTVVAFGTSAPELIVSLSAAWACAGLSPRTRSAGVSFLLRSRDRGANLSRWMVCRQV